MLRRGILFLSSLVHRIAIETCFKKLPVSSDGLVAVKFVNYKATYPPSSALSLRSQSLITASGEWWLLSLESVPA